MIPEKDKFQRYTMADYILVTRENIASTYEGNAYISRKKGADLNPLMHFFTRQI